MASMKYSVFDWVSLASQCIRTYLNKVDIGGSRIYKPEHALPA